MRFNRRQSGFSVLEVTIAMGLLSVGSYGLMSLIRNTYSVQKSATSTEDARAITANMSQMLVNHGACMGTIGAGKSPSPDPFTVDVIRDQNGTAVYSRDGIYGNRALKLVRITVGGSGTEERNQLPRFTSNGTTSGTALVVVEWEKYGGDNLSAVDAAGVKVPIVRSFNLNVALDPATGVITDCFSVGGAADQIWQRVVGNPTDIYYIEGNVGIGHVSSGFKLDVNGDVKYRIAQSTSDERLKSDIRPLGGLDLVTKMRGHRYRWRSDGKDDIGVVAQEMEKVLPEVVATDPVTGFKSVNYQHLVAPLIEAVRELQQQNEALRERVRRLEERN